MVNNKKSKVNGVNKDKLIAHIHEVLVEMDKDAKWTITYDNKPIWVLLPKVHNKRIGISYPMDIKDISDKCVADLKRIHVIYKKTARQYWIFHGDEYIHTNRDVNKKLVFQCITRFLKKQKMTPLKTECVVCCNDYDSEKKTTDFKSCGCCHTFVCFSCTKNMVTNEGVYTCPFCKMEQKNYAMYLQ